ncbi:MAG: hypothetical protein VW338_04910 [Rhodospirillaceae bacterium]
MNRRFLPGCGEDLADSIHWPVIFKMLLLSFKYVLFLFRYLPIHRTIRPGSSKMDMTALFRDFTALSAMAFAGYIVMVVS